MEQVNELKIKQKLLQTFNKYTGNNIPYSDFEISQATTIVKNFIDNLNRMTIFENGNSKKLNELEIFSLIYEFVANRVYVEQDTSHDIIGTLITNMGVCQGYCQLMSFLCEQFNIPFLYKHSETFDEYKNPLGSHANFEVIIHDKNGYLHCLHCDPTIDAPKYKDDMLGFNAFLIQDSNINNYYHKQIPSGTDISSFYYNFLSPDNFDKSIKLLNQVNVIEQMTTGKTEEEIIAEHYEKLRYNLINLNAFLGMNIDFKNLSQFQLLDAYKSAYQYYKNISRPINPDEIKEAIINAKAASFILDYNINPDQAFINSQQIFELRLKKSLNQQKECWENIDEFSIISSEIKGTSTQTMK